MQYLYQFVFYLLANRALMAGAGENGVAIFNVLQNLSYLVLYLYDGAAKAAQPLVSTYAAERNRAGSRSTLTLALATGNGLGILLCLAPRLAPEPARKEAVLAQTISCNSQDIGALTRRVQDFCADHGADAARQYFAGMAVEEICLAAMEHLFANRQDGIVQVTVVAARDGDFVLHFRDNGARRDLFSASDGPENDPGIAVIRKKARRFFYRHYQGFNTLTIQI